MVFDPSMIPQTSERVRHWTETLSNAQSPKDILYHAPDLFTETVKSQGGLPDTIPLGTDIFDPAIHEAVNQMNDDQRWRYATVVGQLLGEGWAAPNRDLAPQPDEAEVLDPGTSWLGGVKGFFGGVGKKALDVLDSKPINKAFDALNWGGDRLENAIGFTELAATHPDSTHRPRHPLGSGQALRRDAIPIRQEGRHHPQVARG